MSFTYLYLHIWSLRSDYAFLITESATQSIKLLQYTSNATFWKNVIHLQPVKEALSKWVCRTRKALFFYFPLLSKVK